MDLVQGFLARLLDKGDITLADVDRGRFRNYLLGALKHFAKLSSKSNVPLRRSGH